MTSPIWKHLTHPLGMTVSLLEKATGLTRKQIRADLAALEAEGKAVRERAPVGKEHLWWRRGQQPIDELTVALCMQWAATFQEARAIRATLQRLAARSGASPERRAYLVTLAKSDRPRQDVLRVLSLWDAERSHAQAA